MSILLRLLNRVYTILVELIFDIFNFSRPKYMYMKSFSGLIIVCFVNLFFSPMTPWSLMTAAVVVCTTTKYIRNMNG